MTAAATALADLVRLGYTAREAAFLTTVAHHSGYFLRRQYGRAIGRGRGLAVSRFVGKLLAHRHATVHTFCRTTQVLHLAAKAVYDAAGVTVLPPCRRRRPAAAITARLMALDYVLDHPAWTFLATEDAKLAVSDGFGIDRLWVPQQRYHGHRATAATVRYFVEGGPLAIEASTPERPVLVASFVEDRDHTALSFERFLERQRPWWAQVPAWRVVFVIDDRERAAWARRTFHRVMETPTPALFAPDAVATFGEYARLEQAFQREQWQVLQKAGLDRLRALRPQYVGTHWARLYERWQAIGDDAVEAVRGGGRAACPGTFEACVLPYDYRATRPIGDAR